MGVGSGLSMYDVVVKRSRSLSHLLMSSCGTIPPCDGRTDKRTNDDSIYRNSLAPRGKKNINIG